MKKPTRLDWGDGNITLHNSGTIAQCQYNYASVGNSTLTSRGYKQVIIKVTPISGNLLTCNFQLCFVIFKRIFNTVQFV